MSENMSDAKSASLNETKEMKTHLKQENSRDHEKTPVSDLHSKVKGKGLKTSIGKPAEGAVEEATEWSQENRM